MSATLFGLGRATPNGATRRQQAREDGLTDIAERPVAGAWPRLSAAMRRLSVPQVPAWTGWILPALILVVWQVAASLGWIGDTVMPSPYAVVAAAWRHGRRPGAN